MKKIVASLLIMLCLPIHAQQNTIADSDLPTEYSRCLKLKKAGVTGIVVFGATWIAGNAICIVEQNRYANDRWDGNDLEEFARLSNEAKNLPAYKRGMAMGVVGCIGTGVSIFLTVKYGSKARRIRDSRGNEVALLSIDLAPQGVSLRLTF